MNSCIPPILRIGSIAIANIIIPIPPSHCRTDLHINRPLESDSTLLYIVAPVVVRPDVASKNASEKVNTLASKKKGRLAKKHNTGKDKTVISIVSLTLIFLSLFLKANIKLNPKNEDIRKLGQKTESL